MKQTHADNLTFRNVRLSHRETPETLRFSSQGKIPKTQRKTVNQFFLFCSAESWSTAICPSNQYQSYISMNGYVDTGYELGADSVTIKFLSYQRTSLSHEYGVWLETGCMRQFLSWQFPGPWYKVKWPWTKGCCISKISTTKHLNWNRKSSV